MQRRHRLGGFHRHRHRRRLRRWVRYRLVAGRGARGGARGAGEFVRCGRAARVRGGHSEEGGHGQWTRGQGAGDADGDRAAEVEGGARPGRGGCPGGGDNASDGGDVMKTALEVAIDTEEGPVWDREEGMVRAGMMEALRWAVDEAATYDIEALTLTLRNKLEELEMKK